jgi:hypothetical protein
MVADVIVEECSSVDGDLRGPVSYLDWREPAHFDWRHIGELARQSHRKIRPADLFGELPLAEDIGWYRDSFAAGAAEMHGRYATLESRFLLPEIDPAFDECVTTIHDTLVALGFEPYFSPYHVRTVDRRRYLKGVAMVGYERAQRVFRDSSLVTIAKCGKLYVAICACNPTVLATCVATAFTLPVAVGVMGAMHARYNAAVELDTSLKEFSASAAQYDTQVRAPFL